VTTTTAPRPYNCQAGLFSWANVWSFQKKQWCCAYGDTIVRIHLHDGLGCPVKAPTRFQKRFEQERSPAQSGLSVWHSALATLAEGASRPAVAFSFMVTVILLGALAVARLHSGAGWTRSASDPRQNSYVRMDMGPVLADQPFDMAEPDERPREQCEVEMKFRGSSMPYIPTRRS
jgi:hypothetical protein